MFAREVVIHVNTWRPYQTWAHIADKIFIEDVFILTEILLLYLKLATVDLGINQMKMHWHYTNHRHISWWQISGVQCLQIYIGISAFADVSYLMADVQAKFFVQKCTEYQP